MDFLADPRFLTIVIIVIPVLTNLVVSYLFARNIHQLLQAVRKTNRRMAPAHAWLILLRPAAFILSLLSLALDYRQKVMYYGIAAVALLIALFVIVWEFVLVRRVADSIEAEFDSRNIPVEYRPSYQTGMFMAGADALSLLRSLPGVAWLGALGSFAYLIGMIAYWVRTAKYKRELKALPEEPDEESLIFKTL